jgi:hypothetical protein
MVSKKGVRTLPNWLAKYREELFPVTAYEAGHKLLGAVI